MNIETIMWAVFWIIVCAALIVDLVLLSKHSGKTGLKSASKLVAFWIVLALLFGVAVFFAFGKQYALEYLTAYIVEYSLSIDNMFVFLIIFAQFAIPKEYQPKVLVCGIVGAILLRLVFVFVGARLINAFTWTIYVFGAILIWTGIKMIFGKKETKVEKNLAFRILKKFLPLKPGIENGKFFIRENGVLYATAMFAAVCVVEMSDIIFAVDSIPAVLSISTDTFIVYSSNIFAIIGLRALYFMLSGLSDKFKLLKYGVAVILFFVGIKMLLSHYVHMPAEISLSIVLSILAASIIMSMLIGRKKA
jgi:tellurite resistance protein TerC